MNPESGNPDVWEKVSEIFTAALALAPENRSAYLDHACNSNPELRAEVESLLASHTEAEKFLESSIAGRGALPRLSDLMLQVTDPSSTIPDEITARYKVMCLIGSGGMGVVYRARDQHLNRDVAIKLLPSRSLQDEAARKSFRAEALSLSRINHPNIATVHDFGTQDGIDFLVMEYISGATLKDEVTKGPLPEQKVIDLGIQLAEGLRAAHEQGVIHRDLKPANLKLTTDGNLKILDFGVAQVGLRENTVTVKSSERNVFAGTFPYVAPELWEGKAADAQSDLWSVGVVLYELITGRPAFSGGGSELINNILRRRPDLPSRINPRISAGLETVILKCLEKNPRHRYQSAAELRHDLQRLNEATGRLRATVQRRRRWIISTAFATLLTVLLFIFGVSFGRQLIWRIQPPPPNTIAVLPLVDLSPTNGPDYFADGITESLTTSLGQIRSLHVVSRTSSMHYKGSHETLATIARQLHANLVLEGSVQRSGNRVRITAQLIDAASDRHLWASTYDRESGDVLSLEDEIARTVAHEVQARLTPEEEHRLTISRPVKPEAHDAYLEGLFYWNMRTPESLARAITLFQKATDFDPGFAPAYVGLADSYVLLSDYQVAPSSESFPKARTAIRKALELDPGLANAHIALAYLLFRYDWRWPEAELEFKRGLELNPNDATAHHWYGEYLTLMGRFDEGLRQVHIAEELEPLSEIITADEGWFLYLARRYDESIRHLREVIATHPNFDPAWFYLGEALEQKGEYKEAIQAYQRGIALTQGATKTSGLGHAYALAGQTDAAEAILHELEQRNFKSAVSIAIVEAGLRDKEGAIHWLEVAYRERNDGLIYLKVHPFFDPIRSDSRFQEMLRRLDFPD